MRVTYSYVVGRPAHLKSLSCRTESHHVTMFDSDPAGADSSSVNHRYESLLNCGNPHCRQLSDTLQQEPNGRIGEIVEFSLALAKTSLPNVTVSAFRRGNDTVNSSTGAIPVSGTVCVYKTLFSVSIPNGNRTRTSAKPVSP